MSIELIIFDIGRVLIQLCDGWQHACEIAGLPRPADIDASRSSKLMDLVCINEVGRLSHQEFLDAASPLLGIPAEYVSALSDAYLLGPFPGAIDLLKELKQLGLKTACLSNTNENHWRLMNDPANVNFGALEDLNHHFASHLVRLRKPDAQIYEFVERETGVAPQQIVFFDDLPENIAAAAKRGWNAHQIEVGPDPIAQIRSHLRQHGIAVA